MVPSRRYGSHCYGVPCYKRLRVRVRFRIRLGLGTVGVRFRVKSY